MFRFSLNCCILCNEGVSVLVEDEWRIGENDKRCHWAFNEREKDGSEGSYLTSILNVAVVLRKNFENVGSVNMGEWRVVLIIKMTFFYSSLYQKGICHKEMWNTDVIFKQV